MSDIKEYIKMRNSSKYDLQWFYKYFIDNGGAKIDVNSFSQCLQFYGLENAIKGLDSKLGLTKLETNEGEFIKILE